MSSTRRDLFHWADYLLFTLSLASTLIVGIVIAIKDRWTSQTSEDYLMAGRKMNWFLVAQSVFASATSSTLIIGLSAEFYYMGVVFIWASIGLMLAAAFTAIFTVPKFFRMRFKVTSAYEILFMAVVLYVPSLVLSQVTDLDIRVSICIGAIVCLIYTSLGGMKAVIWVDNIQVIIIILGLITVLVKGMINAGGFSKAWSIYRFGKRNAWNESVVIGISMAVLLALCTTFVGVAAFALLGGNEPLLTGTISRPDGIFPLYVMKVIGGIPGLPGLVISALYAATLSCLSSGQNALAAVFLEDLLSPIYKMKTSRNLTDHSKAIACKAAALAAGFITLGIGLTVPYFDDYIYSLTRSAESFISGPLFGVFCCAMFLGYTESWGVFIGCLASIIFGFQQYIGWLTKHHKHLGTDQPPLYLKNFTVELTIPTPNVKPNLYDTSYQWYVFIDAMIVIVVASIISPLVHIYRHRGCFHWSTIWPSSELRYTLKDLRSAFGCKEEHKLTLNDSEMNKNGESAQSKDDSEDNTEDNGVIDTLLPQDTKL
ncbi:hypothetical protein LSH36_326g00003 [Paralvinella palmiformis]|uniref:Uncharacterized protein n=1 Tax=Paralvinella palmiformis TaxID=53620 RepID=A0AAD9JG42_9ANNE|nr:hypothetical protein LSH36_326g00003 [Paralvinella palmiformis]